PLPPSFTPFLHDALPILRGFGGLCLVDLRVATLSILMIIAAAMALVLAMVLARRRRVLAITGLLAILIASFGLAFIAPKPQIHPDRKSTRLNSSHVASSY